jgi:glycosyltransferase involved in cell wall biosynthesis
MYPSPERPEFGVFVAELAEALRGRGHDVSEAVLRDARAGRVQTPRKYARLLAIAVARARRERPDVVYAHFLFPPGLIARAAAAAARAPYVVTAHGTDVANARRSGVLRLLTARAVGGAGAVVCVSAYLARMLPVAAPALRVIDCGVDTRRFAPAPRARPDGAPPAFLFVGSLSERKNVGRLLEAFAALGEGTLTVVGGGPLEAALRRDAPPGVRFAGRLPRDAVAEELRQADVLCQPSLVEPFGQALVEALACGRPVVATRVGGPPEYVTRDCGALVDPLDVASIAAGMRHAAALPVPCDAAVAAAREHALERQAERVENVLRDALEGARQP